MLSSFKKFFDVYGYMCKLSYDELIEYVLKKYSEDHRVFHTIEHVNNIFEIILKIKNLNEDEVFILMLSAIYHDIEYNIGDPNNEEKSAKILLSHWNHDYTIVEAYNIILSTKTLEYNGIKIQNIFKSLDCDILYNKNYNELIEYEKKIRREFSKINYNDYKKARIEFLEKAYDFSCNELLITFLKDYVENYKPRIGLYCGSFNPLTTGHLSIIKESERLFDKVIVAIGNNPEKNSSRFDDSWINKINNEVITYEGLTTDLIESIESSGLDVTLVRGIRNGYDLEYESNLLQFLKDFKKDLKYILIFGDKNLSHISSSAIRNLGKTDKEKIKKYIL